MHVRQPALQGDEYLWLNGMDWMDVDQFVYFLDAYYRILTGSLTD